MEKEAILKFINKQKGRHVLTLKDGRVIQGGETFEAELSQIPEAFRDMVTIVSAGESIVAKKRQAEIESVEEVKEIKEAGTEEELEEVIDEMPADIDAAKEEAPAKVYTKKHVGKGKYDVLDEAGKAVNQTPLTGTKAQQLIDELLTK